MEKEVYRHYGHSKFDKDLFIPIHNREFSNKPSGGLWSCPTKDVDIDWKTWSEGNDFALGKLKEHFDFKLKDSAKILEIKDIKDLDKLPRISDRSQLKQYIKLIDSMNSDIDFEELAKEYDGIMVWMYRSKDIDKETRMFDGMYYRMYGWDVDTLVVFNPDIIEEVDA